MMNIKQCCFHRGIKYPFYAINTLLLILLSLPATRYNTPIWWVDNLANLQLQWSLLACLLMVMNFWVLKRVSVILSLLYIALIGFNFSPLYAKQLSEWMLDDKATQTVHSEDLYSLQIAQLNLRYDNPNLAELVPRLGAESYHILVLQEVSDKQHQQLNKLTHYYPYSYGMHQATPSGMAVFSRWPIIETRRHQLGYKSGDVIELLIQAPDKVTPIQLYALHPGSPRNKELWQRRNQTFDAISEKIMHSPFTYKIVVGDFNSSPWSSAFKDFQAKGQLKNTATGFGYMPTWSLASKPLLSLLTSAYIDHNLVSFSIDIINKSYQHIEGSDHRLIVTELGI